MSTSLLQNSRTGATSATAAATAAKVAKRQKEASHRIRVIIAGASAFILVAAISIYGASYYLLPLNERPYSDKYELLKPGGSIGLKLGILGTVLFFIIFLYALRKIIPFLGRFGTAKHWMDFHVIAGVTAPIVIAFHASFKFRGIAGIAFWIMLAVALSGFIGRYLYAQIPRSLTAAELSLTELHVSERELSEALLGQSVYSVEQLNRAMHVPSAERIRSIGTLRAVGEMIALDVGLPFRHEIPHHWRAAFKRAFRDRIGCSSCEAKGIAFKARRVPGSVAEGLSSLARNPSPVQLCFCGACYHSYRRRYGLWVCEPGISLRNGNNSHLADCRKRVGLFPDSLLACT